MADVTFADLSDDFLVSSTSIAYVDHTANDLSATQWMWTTAADRGVTFSGSGFAGPTGGPPTSGTATGFTFDFGGGPPADIVVSGLSFEIARISGPLAGRGLSASEENDLIWRILLSSNDTIDFGASGYAVEFAGDSRNVGAGDTIEGGDDALTAGDGAQVLSGDALNVAGTVLGGNDTIYAGAGADEIYGDWKSLNGSPDVSGGDDMLFGEAGNDTIHGSDGNDTLVGGADKDALYGDGGDDTFAIEAVTYMPAGELYDGGAGTDTIQVPDFATGTGALFVSIGALSSIEILAFGNLEEGQTQAVSLLASHFGAGFSSSGIIRSGLASETTREQLKVQAYATTLDLSGLRFENWRSAVDQVIVSVGGSSTIAGSSVNDIMIVGSGYNSLDAGAGAHDTLDYSGTTGMVTVTLVNAGYGSVFHNGVLKDSVAGFENVIGTRGNDIIIGNDRANSLLGGDGEDTLRGGLGKDTIDGGKGFSNEADYSDRSKTVEITLKMSYATAFVDGLAEDTLAHIEALRGGSGKDFLTGDSSNNKLYGGGGRDSLVGGSGSDLLEGGLGRDTLDGGTGDHDTADYSNRTDSLEVTLDGAQAVDVKIGGVVEDRLLRIENVNGGEAGDRLIGDEKANSLFGSGGNDTLIGGGGNDILDGGLGDGDVADFSGASGSIVVRLNSNSDGSVVSHNWGGQSVIRNVEFVIGTAFNDSLTGDKGANRLGGKGGDDKLDGGGGNDTLFGSVGDDTLVGWTGNDVLEGGDGDDHYLFNRAPGAVNFDHIVNFVRGSDIIELDISIFDIGTTLDASEFLVRDTGHAANTTSQRLIYDRQDGSLWLDPNGSVGGTFEAVQVAVLDNKPAHLSIADFNVV